jgi:MarR family 2-MHQ and catechol resistance regulon transcriptional repressor
MNTDTRPSYGGETGLALSAFVALARAYNAVTAVAAQDVARSGLSTGEFAVLEVLHHKGPLLLNEVQRRILVSSGGITYLVDRLEKRGLVERRDCPDDRRARYAALTGAGSELIQGIFPSHAEAIRGAFAALDDGQKATLAKLLRALVPRGDGAAAEEGAGG